MIEIIKVCGITSPADALTAARAGAAAIGLIFHPGSPRFVRPEQAAMISGVVPTGVLKVGVFVNEEPARVHDVVAAARLDVVQLHGDESPAEAEALDGLRIWKAFRVGNDFDVEALAAYRVEAFLLDAPSEGYGGAGRVFPWSKAAQAKRFGRVLMAGGLDADNVCDAIRRAGPWGVDASSRLESRPGVKDPDKVRRYVEAARQCVIA